MAIIRKIKAGLVKINREEFIGERGHLFYDIVSGKLYLSDEETPGGIPVPIDASSVEVNTTSTSYAGQNVQTILQELDSRVLPDNLIFVDTKEKFGIPTGNVIQLADNTNYFITSNVDLEGLRLEGGSNTTILGGSSESCVLSSTGLPGDQALISSSFSLPLRFFSINHAKGVELDGLGNTDPALNWLGFNFLNCTIAGTVRNYNNFIMQDCAFLNSGALTFDGNHGTIGFSQCFFDTIPGGTSIIVAPTATISRRFRVIYSSFVTLAGETSINISPSASMPVESYILDTVNFSGGGTYTSGVTNDNKTSWINNKGIRNSAEIGFFTMISNTIPTDIIATGTPVKVAGATTIQPITQKFTHSNNRLTYNGAISRDFKITASLSLSSGNNNEIGCYIAKNGVIITDSETYATMSSAGKAENISVQFILELSENDYIEIFVENATSATDIVVSFLSVIAEGLH